MEIINQAEMRLRINEIVQRIKDGAVFIHPTDTIYGLGCNALNRKAVEKIRKMKLRPDQPFSVWAPSTDWIKKNCTLEKEAKEWLQKLPGPYTLILKLKNKGAIAPNVNCGLPGLGVRYPDHWFKEIVEKLGVPIVTTSANKSGQEFMTCLEDLDEDLKPEVDFLIFDGVKNGRPSRIIDLTTGKVTER